jgi:hypothetical protein
MRNRPDGELGERGLLDPVAVGPGTTLDFADAETFEPLRLPGIPYGSDPWHALNKWLNDQNGGRGFYFLAPTAIFWSCSREPESAPHD